MTANSIRFCLNKRDGERFRLQAEKLGLSDGELAQALAKSFANNPRLLWILLFDVEITDTTA